MPKTRNLAALAIGAAAFCFAAGPASALSSIGTYPSIGASTTPYDIIIVTDNGGGGLTAAFLGGGSGVPYDTGGDDVWYGIENQSSQNLLNITLSGSQAFGFENDGIGAGPVYPASCGTSSPCTAAGGSDNTGGYGGPISSFIVTDVNNGSVILGGGLAPGAYTWFALELPASVLTATGINNATPLPAALPMFAGGLGVVGLLARRRKRKAAVAAA